MTLLGALRSKALPSRRRRRSTIVDINADRTGLMSTGDPRLDLARVVNQNAFR